jgi:hypothetical protein
VGVPADVPLGPDAAHARPERVALRSGQDGALVLGNPEPTTSLRNAADDVAKPVLAAGIAIVDPIALWHTVLLAIGLSVALGVKREKAALTAIALALLPWLLALAGASLQGMQKG